MQGYWAICLSLKLLDEILFLLKLVEVNLRSQDLL